MGGARDLDHMGERRILGVEVEDRPVGPAEVAHPARPDVERDGAEVGEGDQPVGVVAEQVVDLAR
jgi:hypothetical protein